jgi:hypothetical protein
MSKKEKIKTLETMVKSLRTDVNKLKLGATQQRTTKLRASNASSSTPAKIEKGSTSPKEPTSSTVRISAQR